MRVITFLRQLVEQGGFWRDDNIWIKTSRIQFVGACNPPTDAGRVALSSRFLRHVPLLLVDFPEPDSLQQIYRTFNSGMLKLFPSLRGEAEAKAVFEKWDLDFAIVGETIAEDRFLIRLNGEVKADLPLATLSGSAPEYDRPWEATPAPAPLTDAPAVEDCAEALVELLGKRTPRLFFLPQI